MKIVNIIGGLGNQMFQYAFALSIQKAFPTESVYIDIHHFNGYGIHNGYELNRVFTNLAIPIATKDMIKELSWYIPNYKFSRVCRRLIPQKDTEYIERRNYNYDSNVYNVVDDCYYEGYWQCARYYDNIKKEIKNAFQFPVLNKYNEGLTMEILREDSVGIHVRRGDYLKDPEYCGICEVDYYKSALEKVGTANKSIYIFSNDIEWCKVSILPLISQEKKVTFVMNVGSDSYWDMFLMSLCKNLIIANSTFSWWGAFFNENADIIIAPKKWINRNQRIDIYLPEWEQL